MYCIQELMKPTKAHESSGICHDKPADITPIFKSTPNLKIYPLCQSCQLACSKHCVPKVKQLTKAQQEQEGACFGMPMKLAIFLCCQLLLGYRKEQPHNQFHVGTILHDTGISLIWAGIKSHLELEKL